MRPVNRAACMLLLIAVFLSAPPGRGYDLSKDRVQYVVTTSHLDTQWLWTIMETTRYYLPLTTQGNFYLFEKYPDYLFNYESAYHYMLIKENYPEDFKRIKEYVGSGNWHLSGGMLVACDVNVPNPESLIRQVLYGNGFFEREFGRRARDVFLPDCFGFGYALPTVAAHCGLIGFSTQKVFCPWLPQPSAAVEKPFDIGMWQGVDGSAIVAAVNPGSYVDDWDIDEAAIDTLGMTTGIYAAYDYMGNGDKGGACCMGHRGCTEEDVRSLLERIERNPGERTKVVLASSDQLFRDLTPEQKDRLVTYRGELLAREHGVGTYTSMAEMKRLNRRNELAAAAAEQAAVMAELFAGRPYPGGELRESWIKFLWHQMHDDLPGTSIDDVYLDYSLPDEREALASFERIRRESLAALAAKMDTRVEGVPVLVHNPLAFSRSEPVEAVVSFPGDSPEHVRVFDPGTGNEVLSQVLETSDGMLRVLFLPGVASCAVRVFDVRPSDEPCSMETSLTVDENVLANRLLEVGIDGNGDIASLEMRGDAVEGRQVLSGPVRLELFNDQPDNYPQWEIRYDDIQFALERVSGPAGVTVIERGPLRAKLRVERSLGESVFVQDISLTANGRRVDVKNLIDWRSPGRLLKASISGVAANPLATYDLQLGVIERPDNTENLYEVPGHQWADITDSSGEFGLAVLNDCKYGWDKPDDNTLRLTLIHTPIGEEDLDIGENHFTFSLYPHRKGWRFQSQVVREAASLNQPLHAVQVNQFSGGPGRAFSLIEGGLEGGLALMALKKCEKDGRLVLRMRETAGEDRQGVELILPRGIAGAWELNGQEDELGRADHQGRRLRFDIGGYSVKTFAVELR